MKHRIYYLLCLALSAAVALVMRDRYTQALFYTLLALPLLSAAVTALSFRRLRVSHTRQRLAVQRGQSVSLGIHVENRSLCFFPYICLRSARDSAKGYDCDPPPGRRGWRLAADPRARLTAELTLTFHRRGVYHVGCDTLEAHDFLRLCRFRRPVPDAPTVYVYPRLLPVRLPRELSAREEAGSLATLRINESDRYETVDFREYREGDHLKDIHWKLSAKGGELMVKRHATADAADVLVALDLTAAPSADAGEALIEAAVSLLHHVVRQGKRVDFLYADAAVHLEQLRSPQAFADVFRRCVELRFDGTVPLTRLLYDYLRQSPAGRAAYLLTASPPPDLPALTAHMTAAGCRPAVIDGGAPLPADSEVRRLLASRHIPYYSTGQLIGPPPALR